MSLSALCNTEHERMLHTPVMREDEETRRDRAAQLEGSEGVAVWMG